MTRMKNNANRLSGNACIRFTAKICTGTMTKKTTKSQTRANDSLRLGNGNAIRPDLSFYIPKHAR